MPVFSGIRNVSVPAPAKVNLFLSVSGRRKDGFHELLTVIAKLNLYDLVTLEVHDQPGGTHILCPGHSELENSENLAVRAVNIWRSVTGSDQRISITINKKIPVQAGLGGGSSDAVATLLGLNAMMQEKLSFQGLLEIATQVGSDCASFLMPGLCVASGRGEKVREVDIASRAELVGKKVLLFKPGLGFSTAQIFGNLKSSDYGFTSLAFAEQEIEKWEKGETTLSQFMRNDLEAPVFRKFVFVEAMIQELKERFQLDVLLCGSGSCCLSLIPDELDINPVRNLIEESWGSGIFMAETHFI